MVDSFVVDYYTEVVVVEGIVGVVAVDGLVVVLHKVFSGGSGRFGSLKPFWAGARTFANKSCFKLTESNLRSTRAGRPRPSLVSSYTLTRKVK